MSDFSSIMHFQIGTGINWIPYPLFQIWPLYLNRNWRYGSSKYLILMHSSLCLPGCWHSACAHWLCPMEIYWCDYYACMANDMQISALQQFQGYREDTGYGGLLFVDPDRSLYKKIGCLETMRADAVKDSKGCTVIIQSGLNNIFPSFWWLVSKHIKSGVFMGILKSAWRGMKHRQLQGDLNQLGGAFILGPGPSMMFKFPLFETQWLLLLQGMWCTSTTSTWMQLTRFPLMISCFPVDWCLLTLKMTRECSRFNLTIYFTVFHVWVSHFYI